jgi:hypothetical protein
MNRGSKNLVYDSSWVRLQNCEMRLLASSCLSTRNLAPTGSIFMKYEIRVFLKKNLPRKLKCHLNRTTITGTLHEDQYLFFNHISLILS